MIDISKIAKSAVLAALYNAAKPQGMGFMHYDPTPMTPSEAAALLAQTTSFDYLKGRVMKIDLSGNQLDPYLYDRDNGQGAAERAIKSVWGTLDVNNVQIRQQHTTATEASARDLREHLGDKPKAYEKDGMDVFELGYSDVADVLEKKIDDASLSNAKRKRAIKHDEE
jgi:hypothetical protein